MDPIEKAIRNTLEKGDASDEAFRERVYRSAFSVLEKALAGRASISPEEAESRRERLRARIVEIESEFAPALPEIDPEDARLDVAPDERVAPSFSTGERLDALPAEDHRLDRRRRKPKRRLMTLALVSLAGLLLLAMAGWWVVFGNLSSPSQEASAPPAAQSAGAEPAAERNWIRIFTPEDSTNVALSGDATAEIMAEEGRAFLRLRGRSAAEARFDIGRGILEQMAGKKALISILASSAEDGTAEIAVECSLAELGDCGRKRFELGVSPSEYLFEVDVAAGQPAQAGALLVHPGIGGGGSVIDIEEIRLAVAEP